RKYLRLRFPIPKSSIDGLGKVDSYFSCIAVAAYVHNPSNAVCLMTDQHPLFIIAVAFARIAGPRRNSGRLFRRPLRPSAVREAAVALMPGFRRPIRCPAGREVGSLHAFLGELA